jgi:hypothetical protein
MSEESAEKPRNDPKNYNYVAVIGANGNVVKLSAVHINDTKECLDDEKRFLQIDGEITTAEAAAKPLHEIIAQKTDGGSTRKTHNGGRKHKGKKSRGKGRKSRSKSKSRSKARR